MLTYFWHILPKVGTLKLMLNSCTLYFLGEDRRPEEKGPGPRKRTRVVLKGRVRKDRDSRRGWRLEKT